MEVPSSFEKYPDIAELLRNPPWAPRPAEPGFEDTFFRGSDLCRDDCNALYANNVSRSG
jgi:hypothetical protein